MRVAAVVLTAMVLFTATLSWSNEYLLVELSPTTFKDCEPVFEEIEGIGIQVRHIFPPNQCIVKSSPGSRERLSVIPGVLQIFDRTDAAKSAMIGDPALAALIHLLSEEGPTQKTVVSPQWPAGGCVARQTPTGKIAQSPSTPATSPVEMFTAQYLIGRVAVGVILMESIGGSENWSASTGTLAMTEVVQGADWLIDQAELRGVNLSYVYEFHTEVPTSYEPIAGRSVPYYSVCCPVLSWEFEWMDDAFSYLGVADEWDGAYELANRLRSDYSADWAYEAFVVMDDNDPDHMFADGEFGYYMPYSATDGKEYPSPVIVMTYNNDGWGPYQLNEVFAHETGHVFGAPDEYTESDCDCGGNHGYLHSANGNCEGCNPASIPCLMRSDDVSLCAYTVSHWGWTDTDGDGPADAIDPNYPRWASMFPVGEGDVVRVFTQGEGLVKTIAVSQNNRDPYISPPGYVIWDGLNNYGNQAAPQIYLVTVNGSSIPNRFLQAANLGIKPRFANISYAAGSLNWRLEDSYARVRCFLHDEDNNALLYRGVWDKQQTAGTNYSVDLDAEAFSGPAIARFYGWRPDGSASDSTQFRVCDCSCHGDPACDSVPNVLDVIRVVNVAFRGTPSVSGLCVREWTDVDCTGVTSATDVVRIVNAAFRGASVATEFCHPSCAP